MNGGCLKTLRKTYRDGLLQDVLPFWINYGIDHELGGFFTCLDRDGSLVDTDKSVWAQGRFSWLLAKVYNTVEKRADWLDLARHGIAFLEKYGFDSSGDGRMFFHVARNGQPVRKRRYNFSESFTAIAYGEFAQATGDEKYRSKAIELFEEFVAYNNTPGLFQPKFSTLRQTQSLAVRIITIATAQELRNSVAYELANDWIDRTVEEIQMFFAKSEQQAVLETVGPKGEIYDHFDGRLLNPGHAIEGAWFILRESKYRGDDDQMIDLGLKMLDWMWERGWDEEYGGIFYFRDLHGLPVQEYWHDMKFWWPQVETIIATMLAYQLTGKQKYAEWHEKVHKWTYAHFPDPEFGEWFGYLHRDGTLSLPLKGSLWKGPFHIPRMQLICWRLVEEMIQNQLTVDPEQ
jgi:N-acylglucosamine 2-epimerase